MIQAINKLQPEKSLDEHVAFSKGDETMIEFLANQAAIALKNAQLYDEAKNQTTRALRLQDILGTFTRELDLERASQAILGFYFIFLLTMIK